MSARALLRRPNLYWPLADPTDPMRPHEKSVKFSMKHAGAATSQGLLQIHSHKLPAPLELKGGCASVVSHAAQADSGGVAVAPSAARQYHQPLAPAATMTPRRRRPPRW
jgi:hypothetical protein